MHGRKDAETFGHAGHEVCWKSLLDKPRLNQGGQARIVFDQEQSHGRKTDGLGGRLQQEPCRSFL